MKKHNHSAVDKLKGKGEQIIWCCPECSKVIIKGKSAPKQNGCFGKCYGT